MKGLQIAVIRFKAKAYSTEDDSLEIQIPVKVRFPFLILNSGTRKCDAWKEFLSRAALNQLRRGAR